MKIEYSDSKKYVLKSDDDAFLGSLTFENWLGSKASITTQFGEFYNIQKSSYLKKHYHLILIRIFLNLNIRFSFLFLKIVLSKLLPKSLLFDSDKCILNDYSYHKLD